MTEKELRKLNRRDLLEMLILQSKRSDELQVQLEESLKQLKTKDLTTAKTYSTTDAETKLNGIFEASDIAAEEYIKAVSGEPSDKENGIPSVFAARQQQEAASQLIINEAQETASRLTGEASVKAKQMLDDVEVRTRKTQEEAETKAQQIVNEAEIKAQQVQSEAQSKAQRLLAEAAQRADMITAEAKKAAQQITEEAEAQSKAREDKATKYVEAVNTKLKQVYADYKELFILLSNVMKDNSGEKKDN